MLPLVFSPMNLCCKPIITRVQKELMLNTFLSLKPLSNCTLDRRYDANERWVSQLQHREASSPWLHSRISARGINAAFNYGNMDKISWHTLLYILKRVSALMSKLKTEVAEPNDRWGWANRRKSLKRRPTNSFPLLAYKKKIQHYVCPYSKTLPL